MKRIPFFTLIILFAATTIVACSKKTTVVTTPPPPPTGGTTNLITLPSGWRLSTTLGTAFPTGIQVYTFDSIYNSKTVKAVCLAYDSKNANFEFKPVQSATAKTPTSFYNDETGIVYGCINGGYFGSNQSFSLVKYNNVVSSPNIKAVTRVFNGTNTSYYPTRAAFGISNTGTPSVEWMYNVGAGNDLLYSYPAPSPNVDGQAPQAQPTASFPAGGSIWNTVSAIGGSPMLVKNNTINISDAAELISINNTTSRPRSAIGYTSNGIVLVVAVEGDNPPTYTGINLADLAGFIKNLGATNAINLDGGGSTSLVIGGTKAVRPGDAGGTERPVISDVLIKKK